MASDTITPNLLLQAYANGVFPMSEGRDDPEVFWVNPEQRGVFPVPHIHISKSLRNVMRRGEYSIRVNSDFAGVVEACADRDETWINAEIFDLYTTLAKAGFAHSVEVWQENQLVGGVYGVALQSAFFGESMFSKATNGSKLALVYLMDRLNVGGFTLFDTQFLTPHLASLGAIEISRSVYHNRLEKALEHGADFHALSSAHPDVQDVLQRNTQTS